MQLRQALEFDNLRAIRELIDGQPQLLSGGGEPMLMRARSIPTAEYLLSKGARIEHVSQWWAGGHGVTQVVPEVGEFLIRRGASLTPHVAAGLGLTDPLREMLAANRTLVDAKGVDNCTPLHFARNIEVAALLLDYGARTDARDDDHNCTPAQWLIKDIPEVSRFLIEHGATPDIFLAVALGDRPLVERVYADNPACVNHRIGLAPDFPPIGYEGRGGTIYQWTLAFNSYPHQIAVQKGRFDLFDYLYEKSGTVTRFLVDCLLARRPQAQALAASHPGLVAGLSSTDLELLARYCWETNTNYEAVKLMLDLGFPVAHPERSHGYSPLHNAAWSGSADLVDLLIERGAPVDLVDPTFDATPLGFAIHCCTQVKRHPEGEYKRVVTSLLDAGSPWDPLSYPMGDPQIDDVFRERMPNRVEGAAVLGDSAALARLMGPSPSAEDLNKALGGAARGGHIELCRKLLDAGADIESASGEARITPLLHGIVSRSHETVLLLLDRGANIEARHPKNSTSLHYAAAYADIETIRLLLSRGAASQIDVANDFGFTASRVAETRGRSDVVQLLDQARKKLR